MTPLDPKEEEIFDAARQVARPQERSAYLDAACAGNPPLRGRLDRLLKAGQAADLFLAENPLELSDSEPIAPHAGDFLAERLGEAIGPYKLLQQIGEGGYGTVYLAQQAEPVRRRVALKVIKLGMDTRQVVARFEVERQALALMDHPHIARVLDAGATATGRPYFVMELVQGITLTEFCDQNQFSIRQRLGLFVLVCHAVEHAHQKGIIHRDLKPSNILVTFQDQVPVPKVIDFGIAKATVGQRLTDKTLFTAVEQFLGTPAYMSPEQAEKSGLDLDTRTDIYSLGVLLYELLTGRTPFDQKELSGGLEAMRRTICEKVPQRPSTRRHRERAPHRLPIPHGQSRIDSDLDWIVMKCLEKDRARRYGTAAALAEDIGRYLADEPVLATPPSVAYQFGKFARRNRVALATAGLIGGVLLLATVVSTVQATRARQAERQTREALRQTEAARQEADQARASAERNQKAERWERYRANLSAASSAMQMDNLGAVRTHLETAPEEHRAWEWRFFHQQMDRADHALSGPPGSIHPWVSEDDLLAAMNLDHDWFQVWNLRTRQAVPLPKFPARVGLVSPDGKAVACTLPNHDIVLCDITSARVLAVLSGHQGKPFFVSFSPDGTRLLSHALDKTIRVWDVFNVSIRRSPLVLRTDEHPIEQPKFSSDGKWIASAVRDKTVRIWDAQTGALVRSLLHERPQRDAYFSSQGDRLLSVDAYPGKDASLWDWAAGRRVALLHEPRSGLRSPRFSPDGARLAIGALDGTIRLWDARTGQALALLEGHRNPVLTLAFSPDGTRLVSGSQDQTLRLWNATNGAALGVLHGHADNVTLVRFSADGRTIISGSSDGSFRLWDVGLAERSGVLRGHGTFVYGVAFHPDGQRVVSASWDGSARLWNATTGREIATFQHPAGAMVSALSIHPRGHLLATLARDNRVRLWDLATAREVHQFPIKMSQSPDSRVRFSGTGNLLAAGSTDGYIHLWDTRQRTNVAVLRGEGTRAVDVVFGPGDQWLASSDEAPLIRIWDLKSRQQIQLLKGHTAAVYCLAVSPDGQWLASGSLDGTVRLWDTRTWQLAAVLKSGSRVYGVAFSPDATRLVFARATHTIQLWDVARRQQVAELSGHTDYVHQVAFSPDGTRLVSGSGDFTVRLWDTLSVQERSARER